jgi:hypothetical protein
MTKKTIFEKICIVCNKLKSIDKFDSYISIKCKGCYKKEYYIKHKEKILKKSKERYIKLFSNRTDEIKKKAREYRAQWRKNNPDKRKAEDKKKYNSVKADPIKYAKQLESVKKSKKKYNYSTLEQTYRDKSKKNLTDNYVKRTLLYSIVKLSYSDIPQELVELKRKQLILKRQIL